MSGALYAAAAATSTSIHQPTANPTTTDAYSALVRKHRQAQDASRQKAAAALNELQESTDKTVSALVTHSYDRQKSHDLIAQEKKLDENIKALHAASVGTQQRLAHWGQAFVGFHNALKDLGDLANWSAAVESDVKDAVAVLEAVVKAKAAKVSGSG